MLPAVLQTIQIVMTTMQQFIRRNSFMLMLTVTASTLEHKTFAMEQLSRLDILRPQMDLIATMHC
jgi:hypothetical protein